FTEEPPTALHRKTRSTKRGKNGATSAEPLLTRLNLRLDPFFCVRARRWSGRVFRSASHSLIGRVNSLCSNVIVIHWAKDTARRRFSVVSRVTDGQLRPRRAGRARKLVHGELWCRWVRSGNPCPRPGSSIHETSLGRRPCAAKSLQAHGKITWSDGASAPCHPRYRSVSGNFGRSACKDPAHPSEHAHRYSQTPGTSGTCPTALRSR